MKTPVDKTVVFTFYSHPMKDPSLRWKARLVFPAGADDDTAARIEINDGTGAPVDSGVFEFAGARISVKDGRGELRCGDFVRGKHDPAIWLYRHGMMPVPGALTFE